MVIDFLCHTFKRGFVERHVIYRLCGKRLLCRLHDIYGRVGVDYKPIGSTYQILAVFANATGIILVTITIAYLLSATDAVTRQRQMAGHISALGNSPTSIRVNAWNGNREKVVFIKFTLEFYIKGNHDMCANVDEFPLIFNFHRAILVVLRSRYT